MKFINKYTTSTLIAAVAVLSFSSCADEPDKYKVAGGTPTINYIRNLGSEISTSKDADDMVYTNGQLVTSATPQSTLCFVGENLRSVYELYFNDKKAVLNNSYMTDNTLIVQVPKDVPNLVSDKIYMITQSKDTVTYDFKVVIDAPQVASMSNEHELINKEATLYGRYFVNDPNVPLTVKFTGKSGSLVDAEIKKIAEDYTSVSIVVPEGAEEGPIYVSSIYGEGKSAFYYNDTRGMMFDFDGISKLDFDSQKWHGHAAVSDDNSLGEGNHYVQLGKADVTLSADAGWDDGNFSLEYWCGSWDTPQNYESGTGIALFNQVDFSDAANMTLKFEMQIPKENPWKAGAMQIIFAGTDYINISGNGENVGANNIFFRCPGVADWDNSEYFSSMSPLPRALYRPWTDTGSYDTDGKWVTVSIPIAASFVYSWDGSGLVYNLKEKDFGSLTMFVCGGGINGEECNPIIRIDNIRAVPNK